MLFTPIPIQHAIILNYEKTSLLGFKEFDSESLKLFTNLIYTKFCVRGGENWITAQGAV